MASVWHAPYVPITYYVLMTMRGQKTNKYNINVLLPTRAKNKKALAACLKTMIHVYTWCHQISTPSIACKKSYPSYLDSNLINTTGDIHFIGISRVSKRK